MQLKKRMAAVLAATVCLASSLFPGAIGAESSGAEETYRIVALGDSLTVGYQPGMTENSVPYGYADRVLEQALFHGRSELENYGIIGLTTPGLNKLLEGAETGTPLTAKDLQDFSMYPDKQVPVLADRTAQKTKELKADLAEADLVVLTIGANDFGAFLKAVLAASTPADAISVVKRDFEQHLNKYTQDAEEALVQLSKLAPNARLYIADQYLPLPEYLKKELYPSLYEDVVSPLSKAVDSMTEKLRRNDGIQVQSVPIATKFKGREGAMTWMRPLSGITDNHPTDEGYEAMGQAYADAIWQEYRKPAPLETGVPISVIVNGKEVTTPYKPASVKNRTFLALRDVTDNLGLELQWIAKTKTAVLKKPGHEVSITAGATVMIVNGVEQPIPVPAFMKKVGKEQKMYVPLAAIADAIDYQVEYRPKLKAAFINS